MAAFSKDTFKIPVGQVSPFQIQVVLLSETQGLVAEDAIVAGVTPQRLRSEDGKEKVARAWIVFLSDEGKRAFE